MSYLRKIRRKSNSVPETVQYCFQVNHDEMLFFSSEDDMFHYLSDYRKRIPIFNLSMFKVEFYKIK